MLALLPLLLACAPKEPSPYSPPPEDREEEASCDYADPEIVDLGGWEGACSTGSTAADWLGFALGPWSLDLLWDDGSSSTLDMQGEPEGAVQAVAGPDEDCINPLMATGRYRFESADGRLEVEADFTWLVEDPDGSLDLGSVVVGATVATEELALEALEAGSTARLRAVIRTDEDVAVGLWEEWTDADGLLWSCPRATTDEALSDCELSDPEEDPQVD